MNYPSYFVLLPSVEPASTTSVATNKSDNGFLEGLQIHISFFGFCY